MSEANLESLCGLLNRISNSLLQYAAESWPWTSQGDSERHETVMGLVRRQRFNSERLAEYLTSNGVNVRLDNYPFDGTPLNYVTLDFFKPRLVEDVEQLVADIEQGLNSVSADPEAERLLQQILADERQNLESIRSL